MMDVRRPSKKTPLNSLSSQVKMYLKYIFGFTWAAAAVHEVLLADGCDDQDLMAGTCKDVLHGMEYYTTPHPHSNLLGQQLYEVLLHYRELLQIMNLNTKIFNLEHTWPQALPMQIKCLTQFLCITNIRDTP